MMTSKHEKQDIIHRYIAAYNRFDIEGMLACIHPEVVFQNIAGGRINAEAVGIEPFRELAVQSRALFSSRRQTISNILFMDDITTVDISFEAVAAANLPNGIKAGQVLKLNGHSEFQFKEGKLCRITDYS